MIFNIITLFPEFFNSPLNTSLLHKAVKKKIIKINIINLRDFTEDKHKQCDDKPFGGGSGMILMFEPVYKAVQYLKKQYPDTKIIYFSPQGEKISQEKVISFSEYSNITVLCGHYEGIDNRIVEFLIDFEISIGDYVLTGGEIPALVFIDAVARFIPGFVQKKESVTSDSLYDGLLKYPQYTKPREFLGMPVPDILLSGNHNEIKKWREEQRIQVTKIKRPDLYKKFIKKEVLK